MDPRYLGLIGKVNWLVDEFRQVLGRIGYLENTKLAGGSFNIIPDNSTFAFTTTIPSGYNVCVVTIESDYDPRSGIFLLIQSCQISGTTLTINAFQVDLGGAGVSAINPSNVSSVMLNYILS